MARQLGPLERHLRPTNRDRNLLKDLFTRYGGRPYAGEVWTSAEPSPGLLPQFDLLDLAGTGHRELVDEDHVTRDLEAGDAALAMLDHCRLVDGLARLAAHEGDRHLREAGVRQPHHGDEVDRRVRHQEGLDLH